MDVGERHGGPRKVIEGSFGEIPGRYTAAVSTFLGVVYKVADVAEGQTLDVVDYVAEKMSEAPAASFPRSLGASLVWFAQRSGLPENQKLCNDDVVKRFLENAMVEATAGKETMDKAPLFPFGVIAALELMVFLLWKPLALKVVAWARLVEVYGVLRMEDMQRIKPADVEWMESGLIAKLRRTKTTGPDKATGVLRVFHPKRNVRGRRDGGQH